MNIHFLALLLASAVLTGCAVRVPSPDHGSPEVQETLPPPSPDQAAIGPGMYAVESSTGDMILFLSPGQGFILRKSGDGCALHEQRGSWTGGPDSLRLSIRDERIRAVCSSGWELRRRDSLIACPLFMASGKPLAYIQGTGDGRGPIWRKLVRKATAEVAAPVALAQGANTKRKSSYRKKALAANGRKRTLSAVSGIPGKQARGS